MKFINDPTTDADDKALLVKVRGNSYIIPGLIGVGMAAGLTLAVFGKGESVKAIGATAIASGISGLVGVLKGAEGEGKRQMQIIDDLGPTPTPPTPAPLPPQGPRGGDYLYVSPEPDQPVDIGLREESSSPIEPYQPPAREPQLPLTPPPGDEPKIGFRIPAPSLEASAKAIAQNGPLNIESARARHLDGLANDVFQFESGEAVAYRASGRSHA